MYILFAQVANLTVGLPIYAFILLILTAGTTKAKTVWHMTWETLGGILGSAVALGAMFKGIWNYGCFLKKRRDDRRREDEENRKTLEDFPSIMRQFNDAIKQVGEIKTGVDDNTRVLAEMSVSIKDLRREQDYYRQIKELELEEAGVCWFECDKDGRTTAVSQSLCELFGLTEDQMLKDGSGWLTVLVEPDLIYQQWKRSVDEKLPYRTTYAVKKKNGDMFYVEAKAARVEHDGDTYRFRGTVKQLPGVTKKDGTYVQ